MSQNVHLIQSLYQAFAIGDGATISAVMDPGIVWNEAENFLYSDRNPYIGPGAIFEGVFGRLASEWDNFQATPSEFVDGGDTIVVFGRYTGVYKATQRSLNAQFVHVWRITDGRATGFQQYTDTAQARAVSQP